MNHSSCNHTRRSARTHANSAPRTPLDSTPVAGVSPESHFGLRVRAHETLSEASPLYGGADDCLLRSARSVPCFASPMEDVAAALRQGLSHLNEATKTG